MVGSILEKNIQPSDIMTSMDALSRVTGSIYVDCKFYLHEFLELISLEMPARNKCCVSICTIFQVYSYKIDNLLQRLIKLNCNTFVGHCVFEENTFYIINMDRQYKVIRTIDSNVAIDNELNFMQNALTQATS